MPSASNLVFDSKTKGVTMDAPQSQAGYGYAYAQTPTQIDSNLPRVRFRDSDDIRPRSYTDSG